MDHIIWLIRLTYCQRIFKHYSIPLLFYLWTNISRETAAHEQRPEPPAKVAASSEAAASLPLFLPGLCSAGSPACRSASASSNAFQLSPAACRHCHRLRPDHFGGGDGEGRRLQDWPRMPHVLLITIKILI